MSYIMLVLSNIYVSHFLYNILYIFDDNIFEQERCIDYIIYLLFNKIVFIKRYIKCVTLCYIDYWENNFLNFFFQYFILKIYKYWFFLLKIILKQRKICNTNFFIFFYKQRYSYRFMFRFHYGSFSSQYFLLDNKFFLIN